MKMGGTGISVEREALDVMDAIDVADGATPERPISVSVGSLSNKHGPQTQTPYSPGPKLVRGRIQRTMSRALVDVRSLLRRPGDAPKLPPAAADRYDVDRPPALPPLLESPVLDDIHEWRRPQQTPQVERQAARIYSDIDYASRFKAKGGPTLDPTLGPREPQDPFLVGSTALL
jgi:hypothetical protein